jgi:hypothetical protein
VASGALEKPGGQLVPREGAIGIIGQLGAPAGLPDTTNGRSASGPARSRPARHRDSAGSSCSSETDQGQGQAREGSG